MANAGVAIGYPPFQVSPVSHSFNVKVSSDNDSISSLSNHSENIELPLNKSFSKEATLDSAISKVGNVCKLCLEEFNSSSVTTFTISSCKCTFCKQCMQCYVEVMIRDGVVLNISCPDAECKSSGLIAVDEIKQLVLSETFEKYQKLKFEQEVAIDPHRTLCPQAMCSTICHVCHNPSDQMPKPFAVSCPMCHLQFCYNCKAEWKTDHKCSNFPLSFGNEFQKLQARAGLTFGDDVLIKRCPVCNIFIEKNNGCAQMTCRNCSHVFCWYCLKVLDNDFLLRHYDKGPCRNKLGHSRSQVVRHRAGVVAIFAAFCLLLFVASPVIILAAPIILCYKCWKCYEKNIKPPSHPQNPGFSNTQRQPSVVVEVRLGRHDVPATSSGAKSQSRSEV